MRFGSITFMSIPGLVFGALQSGGVKKIEAKPTWRQGDVFIVPLAEFPDGVRKGHNGVLAKGEITGHAHRVAEMGSADVFSIGGELYLEVMEETATVRHEEHGPIQLPKGRYAVRIQREYTPKEIVRVVD